jgi:quercetin dioxygenase-like cupin family protein
MRGRVFLPLAALSLASVLTVAPTYSAPSEADFLIMPTEKLVWQESDAGAKLAVVFGDPSKPGLYVIRAYFPPGVMSSPHFHGEDRHVIVVQGTWNAGTDDSWDPKSTTPLKTGTYMFHKAGAVHYDGSAGDQGAMVQIVGMGPSKTTFLFPKEGSFGKPRKLNE